MRKLANLSISGQVRLANFWNNQKAQDLIEYALMAGFVAVAAGAIMPGVADTLHKWWMKISTTIK